MKYLLKRWRTWGLLLAGAWMPVTVTCTPPDVYWAGAPVYVEEPADVVVVDEGPYIVDEGWGFDFYHY